MNRMREEQEEKPRPRKAARPAQLPRALINVLNGSFLTRESMVRDMPFILFLAAAGLLTIGYGYHAERVVRRIERTDAALKEQRAEYISARAELEKQEQQSQVADRISTLGLQESRVAPVKLSVDEDLLEETRTP